MPTDMTRRQVLMVGATAAAAAQAPAEKILDLHQHSPYSGRTDEQMIAHQEKMGIFKTVLLPAGARYGLAAGAGRNDICYNLVKKYPQKFVFFANEGPSPDHTRAEIEKYLKLGAIGIGEQKFPVDADSPHVHLIAQIAREYKVPVLLHFEHNTYNIGFQRFYRILEKYPTVDFIGHAQTWWGNIDKELQQEVLYPKTRVSPGGITDQYLRDYPNMYGDMSAGSGLNALLRDEDHARGFLERHQNKLIYGSDCSDPYGEGERCSGSKQIETIKRLSPHPSVTRKIFWDNGVRVLKLKV
ncbi:MAG: amidohydrolase [Acidobacteria bacterium]|nr:amidohydrolase [Acidobacteriota bacterium]